MAAAILTQPLDVFSAPFEKKQDTGTLRLGTYQKLLPLNPFEVEETLSAPLLELVYSRLLFHEGQDYVPDLAKSWQISEDGLTYVFFLREGVRFHNGMECTSEDVLYSLQLASDPVVSPLFADSFKIVRELKAVSKYRFEITLREPFAPFLLNLWRVFIVPKHMLEKYSEDLPGFLKHPVGTGPFSFISQDESGMRLKANPDYFEGPPSPAGVDVRVYSDKDKTWSAFLRDESDLFFYLEPKNYQEIRQDPDFEVHQALSLGGYVLVFNLRRPELRKAAVRHAIAHAINRRELIEMLENGGGILMDGPFHPDSWAFDPETPSTSYDPQQARELIAAEKIVLNLLLDSKNEQIIRLGKLIRQQLREAGGEVKFHFFKDHDEFKKMVYGDSEMDVFLFVLTTGPEPDAVSRYWQTGEKNNISGYASSAVDRLFQSARTESLREKRAVSYREIYRAIAEDRPAVFLYYPYSYHAASKDLDNFKKMLGSFIQFRNLKDVRKEAV